MELDGCIHIDACRKAYGEEGYPAQCRFEMLGRVYRCPLCETGRVDRDALLALVDEMLSVSIGISSADSIRPLEAAYIVQGYARRIREACGEAVA